MTSKIRRGWRFGLFCRYGFYGVTVAILLLVSLAPMVTSQEEREKRLLDLSHRPRLPARFSYGPEWDSLPALLIVKLRYDDVSEAVTVVSYGLSRGRVLRPRYHSQDPVWYQVISQQGDVITEGTFCPPVPTSLASDMSATPDNVVYMGEHTFLLRIPYRADIRGLRFFRNEPSLRQIGSASISEKVEPIRPAVPVSARDEGESSSESLTAYLQQQVQSNFRLNNEEEEIPQNECYIAINPRDPNNLVAGANDYQSGGIAAYTSTNGGRSWRSQILRLPFSLRIGSDPTIAFDSRGDVYYGFVAFNVNARNLPTDTGIYVARSTNRGQSFGEPVAVVQHVRQPEADTEDKPMIAADPNPMSPHVNNVYVTWTTFVGNIENIQAIDIKLARSTDGGRRFSSPLLLRRSDSIPQQWPQPVVGPNGELYVVWMSGISYRIARSLDGGQTFERDRRAAGFYLIGTLDPETGRQFLNGGFRVINYPVLAVDTSTSSTRGNLYLVWSDGFNGDADILFTRSTDGGVSWQLPFMRLNDDPLRNGRDQFFPWMTVDPTNGDVIVMFYDRRNDRGNLLMDVYVTRSTDGGVTFSPNVKVTTEQINPLVGSEPFRGMFIGDYNGLAAWARVAFPVWTDTRRGQQDIYGAQVRW
ncbi:MAG: sialidase family protein [Acidobacteriota bacterium]|nr:glycoside hydrolase [Blastocatellia bacterium]MDW8239610.1 sialidase family protein [Acidobacteriota bacterium]